MSRMGEGQLRPGNMSACTSATDCEDCTESHALLVLPRTICALHLSASWLPALAASDTELDFTELLAHPPC